MLTQRAVMAASGINTASPWATWNGSLDGSVATFNSSLSVLTSVTNLDANTVIVTWEDAGVSDYGKACVGTISDVAITWGTPVSFSNGSTISNSSVAALSSTEAIVCYRDTGDGNKGKAVVLDVSGTSITVGTGVTFETGAIDAVSVAKLSTGKAIVVYNGSTPKGKAMTLDVASSVITTNTAFQFNGSSNTAVNCVVQTISSSQALVVYSNSGNSSYGTAQVLDISGDTITGNTAYVFNSAASTLFKMAAISSSKFAIIYENGGDSDFSATQILSVSGTVVSYGSPVRVINLIPSEDYISIAKADNQSAFIFYRNVTTNQGAARVASIAGTTITLQTAVVVKAATTSAMFVTNLDNKRVLYTFRDHSDSNKGKGKVSKAA